MERPIFLFSLAAEVIVNCRVLYLSSLSPRYREPSGCCNFWAVDTPAAAELRVAGALQIIHLSSRLNVTPNSAFAIVEP